MTQEELLTKAKAAGSPDELIELAKANGKEMTAEQAAAIFNGIKGSGEISDEELESAVGGCGGSKRKYAAWWPQVDCNPTQRGCKAGPITMNDSAFDIWGYTYWKCKECGESASYYGNYAGCEHAQKLSVLDCSTCKWSKANSPG